MAYPSLAHRLIDYQQSTIPPFVAVESDCATPQQQERMHRFVLSMCDRLADDPGVVGLSEMADRHFTWQQMYKADLQMKKDIVAAAGKLKRWYALLLSLGLAGQVVDDALRVRTDTVKLTPKKAQLLEQFGLVVDRTKSQSTITHPQLRGMMHGWKLLAEVAERQGRDGTFFFSRAIFAPSCEAVLTAFGHKLGDADALADYIVFLEQHGFTPEFDLSADGLEMKVRYTKPVKGARRPLGGFCLTANLLRGNQPVCSIDLVASLKFMQAYDEMDVDLQSYVLSVSRQCTGCEYCIQTNKTPPVRAVKLKHQGTTMMVCPFFLATCREQLDAETVAIWQRMITLDEKVAARS